jgi:YbbR domain-containing protein
VRTSTASVPVRPVLQGSPAKDYIVEDSVFIPPRVQVTGAVRDMDNLDWIWTDPIDISGKASSFSITARLRRPTGQITRIDPPAVEARIKIKPVNLPLAAPEDNLQNSE